MLGTTLERNSDSELLTAGDRQREAVGGGADARISNSNAGKEKAEEASRKQPDAKPEGEQEKEAPPAVSREDKAAAARERFLARKRKAPGS